MREGAIIAEGYELRGPNGKTAAVLHLTPQGQGELSFLDDTGRPRIEVGFDGRGSPGVRLLGPDRHLRASLAVDDQTGAPQLNLIDDRGDPGIKLEITKEHGPSIIVGSMRQSRILTRVSKDGRPSLSLWNQDGQRIGMTLLDGKPVIQLLEGNNVVRSSWNVGADGSTSFSLLDRNEKVRLVVLVDEDGMPAIRFIDSAGKISREIKPRAE